jgi:hypothetical protein
MKGKNERIAFAATENANVCTSVRKTYFTVEESKPAGAFDALVEPPNLAFSGTAGSVVEGRSVNVSSNTIRGLQVFLATETIHFAILHAAVGSCQKTLGHIESFHIFNFFSCQKENS